jgi:glyoxylase I family protein
MRALPPNRVEIIGVDHIYLTVSDFARAEEFYDIVLSLMDFRKGDREIGGDQHRHYFNKAVQISIRPARGDAQHDPYAPGLHHLCLQVATNGDVDKLAKLLGDAGIAVSQPAFYPEYADDYYAIFFSDPDGIRLEVVARRAQRNKIVARWNELTTFLNPFANLKD